MKILLLNKMQTFPVQNIHLSFGHVHCNNAPPKYVCGDNAMRKIIESTEDNSFNHSCVKNASENLNIVKCKESLKFNWWKIWQNKYAYVNQESSCNARVFIRTKTVVNDVNDAIHLLRNQNAFVFVFYIIHWTQSWPFWPHSEKLRIFGLLRIVNTK